MPAQFTVACLFQGVRSPRRTRKKQGQPSLTRLPAFNLGTVGSGLVAENGSASRTRPSSLKAQGKVKREAERGREGGGVSAGSRLYGVDMIGHLVKNSSLDTSIHFFLLFLLNWSWNGKDSSRSRERIPVFGRCLWSANRKPQFVRVALGPALRFLRLSPPCEEINPIQ